MTGAVVACPACGRPLPPAFPGASVSCAGCGRRVAFEEISRESPPPPGPYRRAEAQAPEERESPCPYCGNPCPPLVRICSHCDVRLDSVRCVRCYSLQGPGSSACVRCGQALELEPLLDATDAPCPRCASPLEVAASDDQRVHECGRCGGMFVPKDALAAILARAESAGTLPGSALPRRFVLDEVRYMPCPQCHASMNRKNFGRRSGVIVDVCSAHGTWFDAGELTRAVAYAGAGGLNRARASEQKERKEARARAVDLRAELAAEEARDRIDSIGDLLDVLLFR